MTPPSRHALTTNAAGASSVPAKTAPANTKENDMKDVMVDLETLGRRAGCAILSIGAVAFDAETGKMGPEFYMVVKMASCEKHGLHTDPETVAWWEKQNPEAQKVLKQARAARGNKDLPKALTEFNTYLDRKSVVEGKSGDLG